MADGRMLLMADAGTVARQRLGELNRLIAGIVAQLHAEAVGELEGLDGLSHRGMGASMFPAVTKVVAAVVPAAAVPAAAVPTAAVPTVGAAAVTAFRQVLMAGIDQAAAASAAGRLPLAKDELRRVLGELVDATHRSGAAAWSAGSDQVDDALTELFDARPELRNLEHDRNAAWYGGWLCDMIGITDASRVADSSHLFVADLWWAFRQEYHRAAASVRWADRDTEQKIRFLQELPRQEREPFLRLMGEEPSVWSLAH